jgi:RNA ligase
MVKLHDILDYDLLQKHLAEGVIRRQVHPLYPNLFIYNYTEVAQHDRLWDDVTKVCRGLIVADDVIIARGFNKFHNLNTDYVPETLEINLPNETPLVTEKLDGSMGIEYTWDDKLWVATRGSFASEQAAWATDWIRKTGRINFLDFLDCTNIYEILYQANRIVVDYDYEGLVLTGIINRRTGGEVSRDRMEIYARSIGIPAVTKFEKTLAEAAADKKDNAEGYVLTYPSTGLKVKVKFEEYVRLHRILTGLNPKAIWEMLALNQGDAVDSILRDPKMPSGFIEWFGGWVGKLRGEYAGIEKQATEVYAGRPDGCAVGYASSGPDEIGGVERLRLWRKGMAEYFTRTPRLASVLFSMLDGKSYSEVIWKMLKPRGDDTTTFKKDGE